MMFKNGIHGSPILRFLIEGDAQYVLTEVDCSKEGSLLDEISVLQYLHSTRWCFAPRCFNKVAHHLLVLLFIWTNLC